MQDDYGLDIFIDGIVSILVLLACLPTFFSLMSSLIYEQEYGFGTLDEKSTMTVSSQWAGTGFDNTLDSKHYWTDTHIAMTALVDTVETRTVKTPNLEITYTDLSLLDKSDRITGMVASIRSSTSWVVNWSTLRYFVTIDENGSLIYTEAVADIVLRR